MAKMPIFTELIPVRRYCTTWKSTGISIVLPIVYGVHFFHLLLDIGVMRLIS